MPRNDAIVVGIPQGGKSGEPQQFRHGLQQQLEDVIAGGLGQQIMEADVGIGQIVQRSPGGVLVDGFLHGRNVGFTCPFGGQRGDGGFQGPTNFDQFQQRVFASLQIGMEGIDDQLWISRFDSSLTSLRDFDQPLGTEDPHRLTNDRSGDTERTS